VRPPSEIGERLLPLIMGARAAGGKPNVAGSDHSRDLVPGATVLVVKASMPSPHSQNPRTQLLIPKMSKFVAAHPDGGYS